MDRIPINHRSSSSRYEVIIEGGVLAAIGGWARSSLDSAARKAVIVSNPTVFSLYGEAVRTSLTRSGFEVSVSLMKEGERYKNLSSLNDVLEFFAAQRLSRDDVVVALGGGVVGDLAGFASAVYQRGIRFLQVPTTFLAMIDSSVGGKTGINLASGKNMVGAFHRPSGVLIDVSTLQTLPRRELTAGFCEAVKHGAISGDKLFFQTADFLGKFDHRKPSDNADDLSKLVSAHVKFKASIVRQDETESTTRDDSRSRKILNFGHTFGHALEKVTKYRRLRHGEAVGYGILLAGELSKNLDLLSQNELNSLYDVVHRAGRLPRIADISPASIFDAFKSDKKSSAGRVRWILLKAIGQPVIISEDNIPRSALTRAVKTILKS